MMRSCIALSSVVEAVSTHACRCSLCERVCVPRSEMNPRFFVVDRVMYSYFGFGMLTFFLACA